MRPSQRPRRRGEIDDTSGWFVDETYVRVNGVWRYVYRAVDQYGQVIDVLVSARWDADAARRFFRRALSTLKVTPREVVTDAAAVYPRVLDEVIPRHGTTLIGRMMKALIRRRVDRQLDQPRGSWTKSGRARSVFDATVNTG
ncbi:hypothetical protein GCM10023176_20650 [Micromonospora coerulea]|uniref:DDE domain-containing protein n=1 Tax=Micromonospora coerulea TaxID=47856 RepID=A0ABP8SGB4_9ACTN